MSIQYCMPLYMKRNKLQGSWEPEPCDSHVGEGRRDCRNSLVQQKLIGIFWNLHAHELSPVHAQARTLVSHSDTPTNTHWGAGQLKHIESGKRTR